MDRATGEELVDPADEPVGQIIAGDIVVEGRPKAQSLDVPVLRMARGCADATAPLISVRFGGVQVQVGCRFRIRFGPSSGSAPCGGDRFVGFVQGAPAQGTHHPLRAELPLRCHGAGRRVTVLPHPSVAHPEPPRLCALLFFPLCRLSPTQALQQMPSATAAQAVDVLYQVKANLGPGPQP